MKLKQNKHGDWVMDYFDTWGKRHRENLGKNKRTAQELFDSNKELLNRQRLGLAPRVKENKMTFRELFIAYQSANSRENRASSLKRKENLAKKVMPVLGDRSLASLQDSDFLALLDRLRDEGYEVSSRNRYIALFKGMYTFALERKITTHSPVATIKMFNESHLRRKRVISPEEEAKYLSVINEKFKKISLFALYSACRTHEVIELTFDRVDMQKKAIFIPASMNKSHRDRTVPLIGKAWEVIQDQYPKLPKDNVISIEVLKEAQNLAGKKVFAGINDSSWRYWHDQACKNAKLENFHRHDLRHTFASRLLESGATVAEVAAWLGDSVEVTARTYLHAGTDRMRQVGERLAEGFR